MKAQRGSARDASPLIDCAFLKQRFRACGREQRALRSPSALLRMHSLYTILLIHNSSNTQFCYKSHVPTCIQDVPRRFPKGDRKALWSRPQARPPCTNQAGSCGAPVARRSAQAWHPRKGSPEGSKTPLAEESRGGSAPSGGVQGQSPCSPQAKPGSAEGQRPSAPRRRHEFRALHFSRDVIFSIGKGIARRRRPCST